MVEKIEVLYIRPNQIPKEITIFNTLGNKQKLVKGKIEVSYLANDEEVCLICNEEGKINGSLPNRDIGHDIIYGDFLIVGDDYINGDFISLTKEQLKKYKTMFDEKSIIKTQSKVNARELVRKIIIKKK